MSIVENIECAIEKIKSIDEIEVNTLYIEEADSKENKHNLDSSLNEVYLKYKRIKIVWTCKDNKDNGYFELLNEDEAFAKQEELIDLSKEVYGNILELGEEDRGRL